MSIKKGDLGNAIRTARIKKGYTQEQLAEMLNITPGHLQHMECERRNPSVPMLFQMMQLLDFSVDALDFPLYREKNVLHTDGLSEEQKQLLLRLIDTMKK